jgi:tryptophanyl-tRNA synthetase
MNEFPKLFITREVKEKYPELEEVLMPVFGVSVHKDESILTEKDFRTGDVLNQPEIIAFREFFQSFNVDIKKTPPSVEHLYQRFVKTGRIPHINNVVDICNKVAVETLIPTGVFDLDKVKGDMVMRYSFENEEFHELGGDIEKLPAGLVVIADEEKILILFPARDSIYQNVTDQTKNVMILADKVAGIDLQKTRAVVVKIGEMLGGQKGDLFTAQIIDESPKIYAQAVKDIPKDGKKHRVYAGMRPTGFLHVGNYLGAAKGFLALQDRPDLECFYQVVQYHGITTPYDPETYQQNIRGVFLDYLGAGLDPKKCHISVQLDEHIQLAYLLSTIYQVSRLEDLPTYKEKKAQHPEYVNMGLLYYPVLMAADILCYKAELVPVGIDQEPHIEVTREVARKFNTMFEDTFPEPKRFDTPGRYVPSLLGEGKMSKSVEGSYITLTDDLVTIKAKLAKAPTDSGHGEKFPESGPVVNLVTFVELFEGHDRAQQYRSLYKESGIKYQELKNELAEAIYKELQPIQERRKYYEAHPELVEEILAEGKDYASKIARETLTEVRAKMGLSPFSN